MQVGDANMEVKVLRKEGARLTLHIKGMSLATVNALRRAIISDLPCFAIDEVSFLQNTSAMFNEYLANRLALVPLTYEESIATDAKVSLSLNSEGPCMVYSRDLKSSDEQIRPYNENAPIMKLAAGQKLVLEATAVRNTSKEHAKYQCALASYSYYPELKKKGSGSWDSVLKEMPPGLVSKDGKIIDYSKIDAIDDYANQSDDMELKLHEDEFLFHVESYNNVEPMQHFETAIEIIGERLDEALKKE